MIFGIKQSPFISLNNGVSMLTQEYSDQKTVTSYIVIPVPHNSRIMMPQ